MQTGVSELSPAPGEPLDLAALEDSVEESGFELLGVELELTGQPAQTEHGLQLTVVSTGQSFRLASGTNQADRTTFAQLSEQLDVGKPLGELRVIGPARADSKGNIELVVEHYDLE